MNALKTLTLTLALAVLALGTAANAAIIVADDFDDKTDGALNTQGGGFDGTGSWTTNWGSDPDPDVSSGVVVTRNDPMSRSFDGISAGDTVYIGATIEIDGGDSGFKWGIDLNAVGEVFGMRDVGRGSGGVMWFGNSGSPGLDHQKPFRFVLRAENIGTGSESLRLWVDDFSDGTFDVSETVGDSVRSGSSDVLDPGTNTIGFSGVALGSDMLLDDLNIVTTFDEAANATTIPEPATLALLGLGGAVMLAGRKRS